MMIKNKRGMMLAVVLMVMTVLVISTAVFFATTLSERTFSDIERFALQALNLAESGANQGLSELRARIRTTLSNNLQSVNDENIFQNYVNTNPLGLLRDYAGFTLTGTLGSPNYKATFTVTPLATQATVHGTYSSTITVTMNGNPSKPHPDIYVFPYNFIISSTGRVTSTVPNTIKTVNLTNGAFAITVQRNNFARFALFTSHHETPGGTTVWFTAQTNFTGPVHTNTRFSFAGNPSGTFSEEITQHLTTARFYNNNSVTHLLLNANSNPPNDVPIFTNPANFQRGVSEVNLPSSMTQSDMTDAARGSFTQNQVNSQGVYVPNQGGALTGGIYVNGDASINMNKDSVDPENKAVFALTQGSTTTTITVEYAHEAVAANTVVKVGAGAPVTYQGIPDGTNHEGPLIYVTGGQATLKNPSGTDLIVQKKTNMTVACDKNIIIQDNIKYQEYNPSPLNATGYNNMLGLITWGGNSDVIVGSQAPNNVEIHAIVFSEEGEFRVDDYDNGSPRGTATLLGGVITNFYGPFGTFTGTTPVSGYGRNFVYDTRALNAGLHPPYFPVLANFIATDDGGLDNRLRWQG